MPRRLAPNFWPKQKVERRSGERRVADGRRRPSPQYLNSRCLGYRPFGNQHISRVLCRSVRGIGIFPIPFFSSVSTRDVLENRGLKKGANTTHLPHLSSVPHPRCWLDCSPAPFPETDYILTQEAVPDSTTLFSDKITTEIVSGLLRSTLGRWWKTQG